MRQAAKAGLRKVLKGMVIFKSHEYRLTAFDLLRRTPALRGETSPLTLYLDWRHEQISRLNLDFYRGHPILGDGLDSYYGKVDRIALVVSFLESALSVSGDVAEFGVFRGHTAMAIDRALQRHRAEKQLYLFDSFAGMPEITHPLDGAWKQGDLANPVGNISELFKDSARVKIVPGYFSETLPQYSDLKFAFCHVDADLYTSVMECLTYILPRLSEGGVIVFDDYGFRDTHGARAVVEECLGQTPPSFIPLPTGQAVYFCRPVVKSI